MMIIDPVFRAWRVLSVTVGTGGTKEYSASEHVQPCFTIEIPSLQQRRFIPSLPVYI